MPGLTRAAWEDRLLARLVQNNGRITIFDLTENRFVAHAADRLVQSGVLSRRRDDPADRYPLCVFAIDRARLSWRHNSGDRP